jgi:hypothetical protein
VSNRRDSLAESFKNGKLLEAIYARLRTENSDRDELALELAGLHNEGLIDLVAAFAGLKRTGGPDFFRTRHIFQQTLPHLNSPVAPVMRCVLQLCREAGQDGLAGLIIEGFIGFCAKESSRPRDALKAIEADPEAFADLLAASLSAGSRVDNPHYLAETMRLCEDKNIELRKRAVYSVGRLSWPEGALLPDCAFAALERSAASETNDQLLANVVRSSFGLLQRDKTRQDRIVTLIASAVAKGSEYTRYAASEIFGLCTGELPASLIDVLVPLLENVEPTSKGSLDNIDYGISHLLQKGDREKALRLLEGLLLAHPNDLTLNAFDTAAQAIRSDGALLSKILTRWFLRGDPVLCEGIQTIVAAHHGDILTLEIDPAELRPNDLVHATFAAHKAIGYLFFQAVTAASILISLMRWATDDETLNELGSLLFDPLLLNYTGSVHAFAVQRSSIETGKVKETIDRALKAIDEYLDTLRSVGTLPALHPSEAHREAHHRNFSLIMTRPSRLRRLNRLS